MQRALERHRLAPDSLSLYVHAVDQATPLLSHHPSVARNPASVMKLVTTLAGLQLLGPGFQWKTSVYADGPIQEGRLDGNLYFEGGGDPFLVTEKLWRLLGTLRAMGLREVAGDLVVDNRYFESPQIDPGAFDRRPYRSYNAVPSALTVNFKSTHFNFWPDRDAGRVNVTLDPPSSRIEVHNRLELVSGSCEGRQHQIGLKVVPGESRDSIRFWGKYPVACGRFSLQRSLTQSSTHALGVIEALWRDLGGAIDGGLREGDVPESARRLTVWTSESLADHITGMNKFSNNIMTRQLLLTIAAERDAGPGTVAGGRRAVSAWLASLGLDPSTVFVDNGSGLSRDARASAATIGQLLLMAYRNPLMPEFISSLPLSGVDGTLRRRFEQSPLAGHLHLKTGLLDHVRSIAGYVVARSGRTYVVAMLQNHRNVHQGTGTKVQNALLEWLFEQ